MNRRPTRRDRTPWAAVLLVLGMLLPAAGCASVASREGEDADYPAPTYDPLEPLNRAVFRFNMQADRLVLRPIAEVYEGAVPRPVRRGVANFYDNLTYPYVVVNSFLQGKGRQGLSDTTRFVVNSTVGIVGIFDVASRMGIPLHDEDFGQTLAVWGVGDGPYLVLPLLGPSNARDATGLAVMFGSRMALYPPYWVDADLTTQYALLAGYNVDMRARWLPATRLMEEIATDPYAFTRESYRQRRLHLIHDGAPPLDNFFESEDFFSDDDFFEDEEDDFFDEEDNDVLNDVLQGEDGDMSVDEDDL
jgi:phospholipid-binding lipoprotein MlaA